MSERKKKKKNMPNYPTITTLNLLKGAKCFIMMPENFEALNAQSLWIEHRIHDPDPKE